MDVPIELCVSAKYVAWLLPTSCAFSFIAYLYSSSFVRFSFCRVYKASTTRRTVLFVLFLAMYAVVLPFCYFTAGEPRKAAMIAAQKLADEKWANEAFAVPNVTLSANGTELSMSDDGTAGTVELDVSVTGDTLATSSTSTSPSTSAAAALAVAAEADKLKREKENKVKDSFVYFTIKMKTCFFEKTSLIIIV